MGGIYIHTYICNYNIVSPFIRNVNVKWVVYIHTYIYMYDGVTARVNQIILKIR